MSEKFDKIAYNSRYNKDNYANINLKGPPEVKARWELQAKSEGISLTALIRKKMEEK